MKRNGIYKDGINLARAYAGIGVMWCAYIFGFWGFRPHPQNIRKMIKQVIKPIPKDKKCRCGREITNHHFFCDKCYSLNKRDGDKMRKTYEKIKNNILPKNNGKYNKLTAKKPKPKKYSEKYLEEWEKRKERAVLKGKVKRT